MTRPGLTGERSLALFLLGLLIFNPPLLSLFSVDRFFSSIPLLYFYLFAVWGGFIALIGYVAGRADTSISAIGPGERPSSIEEDV